MVGQFPITRLIGTLHRATDSNELHLSGARRAHMQLKRKGQLNRILVVFMLNAALVHPAYRGGKNDEKRLEVKPTFIGQKNCSGSSPSEVPVVRLGLRLKITNLADTRLIVSKDIGMAWYGIVIAKDEKALVDGRYESKMNIDWESSESDFQNPPTEAPPAEFTILDPHKSFSVETTVHLPVQGDFMYSSEDAPEAGKHVLQLDLGTWFHIPDAGQFKIRWKKYGDLVYLPTVSDAVPFQIPPQTDFTSCKP